jgi:hypothetical protein
MAKSSSEAPGIEFVGPPGRLIAVGALPDLGGGALRLDGPLAEWGDPHRPLKYRNARGVPELKLRLRPETKPGEYRGTLWTGKANWPVLARVLPVNRVSVSPAELVFTGPPGATATCLTTLVNRGNTDIVLPAYAPVGIFDDDGIETAFAATYARKTEKIDDFLSAFTGKLREAHGGLMKLSVLRGAGTHKPGASVALEVAADLPGTLPNGHRFHGVWTTDFANLAVSVTARK